MVNASLDIAKIILASDKRQLPDSYKDTLRFFGAKYIDEDFGEKISEFANLRNILAHEYLDIRWKQIKNFIKEAGELLPKFIKKIKLMLK